MGTPYIPLPERPRRYRFALTPLADAMFQLLIFFMLSTSLTPYSLVTLKTTSEPAEEAAPAAPVDEASAIPAPPSSGTAGTIWVLGNATVSVDGQRFEFDQLPALAEALGTQDEPGNVVIEVTDEARVQDVAKALESLSAADVDAVQLSRSTK